MCDCRYMCVCASVYVYIIIPRTSNTALLAESSLYSYYGVICLATAFLCYSNGIFGIQLGMH